MNKLNVDRNNMKNWQVQKITELWLKQIHSMTYETLGNNQMQETGSLTTLEEVIGSFDWTDWAIKVNNE